MVDNPKKAQGDLKPGAHFFPMSVLPDCFEVMRTGAAKYGLKNWRAQPIRASTYYDAIHRHTRQWFDDLEDRDIESQKSHLAHVICCAAIALDSINRGLMIDDRADTEVLQPKILKEQSFTGVWKQDTRTCVGPDGNPLALGEDTRVWHEGYKRGQSEALQGVSAAFSEGVSIPWMQGYKKGQKDVREGVQGPGNPLGETGPAVASLIEDFGC